MLASTRKMLILFSCQEQVSLCSTGWDSFLWMLCVTVCKLSERDGLWKEDVKVDETTCRENLGGEEAQSAKKQCGKAGDWLQPRAAVCIAGGLHGTSQHFS